MTPKELTCAHIPTQCSFPDHPLNCLPHESRDSWWVLVWVAFKVLLLLLVGGWEEQIQ